MYILYSKAQRVFNVFNVLILTLVSLLCLLPFANLLAISFSSNVPVSAGKVLFWPIGFTTESYKYIFANNKFIRAFGISIVRVILGVGINLLLCVLTAYPLSRSKNRMIGRDLYMGYFVLTMIVGGGLIPTYIIVMKLHLLNTIWALVLPGALPVWNMIILMNFIRQLPQELEDAAMIDGAGPAGTLRMILLPLLKPALATIGLFCIVGHWNDWFSGLIYMRDPANYPLQTYLQTILRTFEQILREAGRSQDYLRLIALINARTGRAAQVFVSAIPVMAIYPFLQKYFVKGMVIGSVKG